MDNPQLVDYIRTHMGAGHTEASIRSHLANHGWPAAATDAAFDHYHRSHVQSRKQSRKESRKAKRAAKQVSATRRPDTKKRKRAKRIIVLLIVVSAGVLVAHAILNHKAKPAAVPQTHQLTLQQRQSVDVITIGGAVGQYVAANGSVLPTRVSIGPDASSVVLCGATCDPTTWQVSALSAYKPANVKLVPYASGIKVPDAATMYLVPGIKCKSNALTTQGVTAMSMSILYAIQTDTGLAQRCVML